EVLVRTGRDATEEILRREGSGKRMIHLSTHAFFLDEACPATVGLEVPSDVQGEQHQVVLAMPDTALTGLFLSGMALASANHRGETDRGDTLEDGILTAEEISSLDLSGVECVVLSACDTGLGKILPGEGVLGLQRAFLEAGARAIVVSLWRVQDEFSAQWMVHFYQEKVARGRSTADAVHLANTDMIRSLRQAGRTTHPFYWGAFIATGDWR